MKINEVAKLCGVTVRTLHYYDAIDLLKPSEITTSGYRLYNQDDLDTLQQILFFRELDFPLSEIREIMTSTNYDKNEALLKHRELLLKKQDRLSNLIKLVDKTLKGDEDMSFKEFDMSNIEKAKKDYAAEVKARWGNSDAYKESEKKTSSYDEDKWGDINGGAGEIFKKFASLKGVNPSSDEVQDVVKQWQDFITENFYACTKEILAGLGMMYVADERFQSNIDSYGDGTAKLMSEAISIYCEK